MDPKHAADFEALILDLADLYGRPAPAQSTVRLWWNVLDAYPWALVRQAAAAHVRSCKFFPRPADLIEYLTAGDGRPGPDEAWATAIQAEDEAVTLVWTAETAAAWGIANPVLEAGDKIGGRKTFLAAYERLVAEARRDLKPAAWSVSLGHDQAGRHAPIAHAVELGRLQRAQVRALLAPPHDRETLGKGPASPTGLLAATVTALPDMEARSRARFLAILRQSIAGAEVGNHTAVTDTGNAA
jgi:hypothetical protein